MSSLSAMESLASEVQISDTEFQFIQRMVREQTGIALSEHKRSLVTSRLGKRLRALGRGTFGAYCD